jgi:hypothetical protein
MALSSVTRKQARSDLRSRLANLSTEKLSNDELEYWLNLGQFDIASRLSMISTQWYGEVKTAIDASTASPGSVVGIQITDPAQSEMLKINQVVGSAAPIEGKQIPWAKLEELYSMADLSTHDNHVAVASHGDYLYFFVGASVDAFTAATVDLFYLRKPTAIIGGSTTDSTILDIPDEYVDLVIMFAQSKAYQKLGMLGDKQGIDTDIQGRLNDIRGMFANEMGMIQAEDRPGVQTPRNR